MRVLVPQIVRIVAPAQEIERRLHSRHGQLDQPGLARHLTRAPELSSILGDSDLPMMVIENIGRPLATAEAILAAIEWPLTITRSD